METTETNRNHNFKYVIPLIAVAILLLALFLVLWLVQRRTNIGSKAYTYTQQEEVKPTPIPENNVANTYAFASPLKAKSGGELIRLTVFVLNDKGLGVVGQEVSIPENNKLIMAERTKNSDSQGKAYFDISSNSSGVYIIEPQVGGKAIGQRVTITFE